jgi:cytochrome c
MHMDRKTRRTPLVVAMSFAAAASLLSTGAWCADAEAAEAMAKQNKCFQCHSIDKAKVGPTFKDVAKKYKGNKEAEAKLTNHVTGGGKYKDSDGKEQAHPAVKSRSADDTKNLVGWILSL